VKGSAARWVPAIGQARTYERSWLPRDLAAGLVLLTVLAPAGMAYAQASGLPPVTGLYATIVPLVVYALLGPSRILVMGPDSGLAPLIAAVVVPLSGGDAGRAVALAGLLSILAGAICIVAGLARFGFLAELLSAPVRYGYLNGIGITIIASQLPRALGIRTDAETPLGSLLDVVDGVLDGRTVAWTAATAGVCMAIIVISRAVSAHVPGSLLAVVAGIGLGLAFDLGTRGVALVGDLPTGVPTLRLPDTGWADLPTLLGAAFGIAFISFTDTSVLARVYALKRGDHLVGDKSSVSNQELVALGAVNVAAGLFQGFPVSGSQSRTPVAEEAGACTQLTGLVAAAGLLVVLLAAPSLFRHLPSAALAAVVLAAALRIFELRHTWQLATLRRSEFILSLVAAAGVVVLGPVQGVGVAVLLSLLNVVRRVWRPHTTELVRVDGIKGYHDSDRHPEGALIPGLMLYRFDAPLFFANAQHLRDDLLDRVDRSPTPVHTVVITAEPMTDVDTTAAVTLGELVAALRERGVELRFAELKGHVREQLESYGLVELIGRENFARTVGEAVKRHVGERQVPWVDWEDRDEDASDDG
jgi:high affinity sulfate transporter 1